MNKSIIIFFFLFHQLMLTGQSDVLNIDPLSSLPAGTEIAVGIYEEGIIKKYGFIVEKNQFKRKNNSEKLFEVGSITKVFTTLSALEVLKKYQIEVNSSVVDYLPEQAKNISTDITFFQLMTHTSGLPKMPNNFKWSALRCPSDPFLHYCEKRMIRYLKDFSPKENVDFKYSNIGMSFLGYLISSIDEQPLERLMENEIFHPLKMKATSLGISKEQFHLVANPIGLRNEPKRTWKFSDETKGAGNLYSNIDDMTLFLKFLFENEQNEIYASILKMEKERTSISEKERMGLGWRIFQNKSKINYHGGITYGFKSLIAYNREAKSGIVILTNAKGLSRKENKILKEICFQYLEKNKSYN